MPNTLGHLGVQPLLTRFVIKQADLIWIYIGILIPDLTWILQRFIRSIVPGIDLYDIRLYCVIQSSLFFSLILAAAFALSSSNFKKVFIILSFSSLLHLIVDSLEIKWGNGIQLLVPFDYRIWNFGFFWPESIPIYAISLAGLVYILFKWKDSINPSLKISFTPKKLIYSLLCFLIYFFMPLFFLSDAEEANNHFVKTLREYDQHPGKYFEVDRGNYFDQPDGDVFVTPFKRKYKVIGLDLDHSGSTSIKAKFLSKNEIQIVDYHFHSMLRDAATYLALLLIALIVLLSNKKFLVDNLLKRKLK